MGNFWPGISNDLCRRAIDAEQLILKPKLGFEGGVNSLCLPNEVRVISANDDAEVVGLSFVEIDEVAAIEGQYSTLLSASKSQHFIIGNGLLGVASFLHSQNIVSQASQSLHDRQREIFIGG
jgi:hypothetical protein